MEGRIIEGRKREEGRGKKKKINIMREKGGEEKTGQVKGTGDGKGEKGTTSGKERRK